MEHELPSDTTSVRLSHTDLSGLDRSPRHVRCGLYLACTNGKAVISTGAQRYDLCPQTELIFLTGSLVQRMSADASFHCRALLFPTEVFRLCPRPSALCPYTRRTQPKNMARTQLVVRYGRNALRAERTGLPQAIRTQLHAEPAHVAFQYNSREAGTQPPIQPHTGPLPSLHAIGTRTRLARTPSQLLRRPTLHLAALPEPHHGSTHGRKDSKTVNRRATRGGSQSASCRTQPHHHRNSAASKLRRTAAPHTLLQESHPHISLRIPPHLATGLGILSYIIMSGKCIIIARLHT